MVFLDSNLRLGKGLKPSRFETFTLEEAHRMLDYFGILKALVRLEIQEG